MSAPIFSRDSMSLLFNIKTIFEASNLVGRAGFEPATLRFLLVSPARWVTPTVGRHLQRLRQPNIESELTRKLCQAELPPDRIPTTNRTDLCVLENLGSPSLRQSTRF